MKTLFFLILFILCISVITLNAQINLGGKIKSQSANRVDNKIDQGIGSGLDAVENGVKSILKKKKNQNETQSGEQAQEEEVQEEQTGQKSADTETEMVPGPVAAPSLAAYSKFDFIPGQKVIFYDDFSQDNVGDFPALWFSNGSGEVVTLNNYPGKWLGITAEGCYYPERDLLTTENFTVEYDMICNFEEGDSFEVGFYFVSGNIKDPSEGGAIPGIAGVKTTISPWDIVLSAYSDNEYAINSKAKLEVKPGEKIHLSYWIQKQRMRIYLNEKKIIDSPRILPTGYKFNILRFEIADSKPYISNFRVATGLPDTRNKLITEGKLITYGIYFDVNADKVKPESFGTLKEIAAVLNEVPDVRVRILGHTDTDGDEGKNLDLSKRRAAAVREELSRSFGVDASRLETDGKGESQPVAANDSPANKALNRRVEFIKL